MNRGALTQANCKLFSTNGIRYGLARQNKEIHMLTKITIYIFCLFSAGKIFADDEIIIQSDYWEGSKCLENGVPYQVPASIYKEAENCNKDDIVLELGSGGSTIFFAKRCKHVTTIETDQNWAMLMMDKLNRLNLQNVNLLYIPNQNDIELFLHNFNTDVVSIFSVDTSNGYNRSAFVNQFFEHGISEQLRMLVLDNYGNHELFPDHYNKEVVNSNEWDIYTYDDPRWSGNGTKLCIKKSKNIHQ